MTRSILHRGPDDHGVERIGPVALGHARLSIIDLSETGHQPMTSRCGRYTICYNGETYNFHELRERLNGLGKEFRGTSDSEVLLEAFAQWGPDAFAMFEGMFALAIWDAAQRRLYLARDRFGIKPLFYHRLTNGLIFGSEIKAILASGQVTPTVNATGLAQYMYYGNNTGSTTLFDGITQVDPGQFLICDSQGVRCNTFWRIEQVPQHQPDLSTACEAVRERLEAAVQAHLVSDVPVGVFLSGGIDSSAITALASRHYGAKLHTYAVGFDFDRGVNELSKAQRVAEQFGTEHHELHVRGGDIARVIEKLVGHHDQPFADAANIPLYLLCEQLAGEVKVVLQGDGGDEIFAGYRRHGAMSRERLWRPIGRIAAMLDWMRPRGPTSDRIMRFFQLVSQPDRAMQLALLFAREVAVAEPPIDVLSSRLREKTASQDPFSRYREIYDRVKHLPPMQQVLYAETMGVMVDSFMEKVDRATMAHGMEARVPFLDAGLTEYVLGLPAEMKVRRGEKKRVLRAALRGIVPDDVLDGPKTGFGVPYGHWLRTSLAEYCRDVVVGRGAGELDLFDQAEVERRINDHIHGRRDYGFLLYKLLNLTLWWDRYIARPSKPEVACAILN